MNNKKWLLLFSMWFIAMISILGSLFFSEVLNLSPCSLCWYQRICLFPLGLLLLQGLLGQEAAAVKFSLPLISLGWLIALFHSLLYYGVLPRHLSPCQSGVSCVQNYAVLWGLSIPLLSMVAFSFMLILGVIYLRLKK